MDKGVIYARFSSQSQNEQSIEVVYAKSLPRIKIYKS